MACPLCDHPVTGSALPGADERDYYHCRQCQLIFADPFHYLSPQAEKAHYLTHENRPDDPGYVAFLNRLVEPLLGFLEPGMRALDYGCGPGPTLSGMLRQAGVHCDDYDPLFLPAEPQPPYDVITATECLEHFHQPGAELVRMLELLRPGGLLGIMTERWTTAEAFASWYYTRDPTHVVFYHARTFDFLCDQFGLSLLWMDDRQVAILQRDRA